MNITESEFNGLTLIKRIQLLYKEGTFLMAVRYYGYKINLYILNNFLVEVFYNHKLDKVEVVEVMEKYNSRIKFYADQIRITEI